MGKLPEAGDQVHLLRELDRFYLSFVPAPIEAARRSLLSLFSHTQKDLPYSPRARRRSCFHLSPKPGSATLQLPKDQVLALRYREYQDRGDAKTKKSQEFS
jgi:hypothetical protein